MLVLEEGGGDHVLDLRGARQGVHGGREGLVGDGARIRRLGMLPWRNISAAKDTPRRRPRTGDPTVGEQGAHQHDGETPPAPTSLITEETMD